VTGQCLFADNIQQAYISISNLSTLAQFLDSLNLRCDRTFCVITPTPINRASRNRIRNMRGHNINMRRDNCSILLALILPDQLLPWIPIFSNICIDVLAARPGLNWRISNISVTEGYLESSQQCNSFSQDSRQGIILPHVPIR